MCVGGLWLSPPLTLSLPAWALQFFFIERKGTRDQSNEYVLKEDPITAITQRAADKRCAERR